MIDVVGISCEWELRIRAVKRGVIRALDGCGYEFTSVVISMDIADAIQRDTKIIGTVGKDTTFEGVPLNVDTSLPNQTVLFIWKEK